MRPRLSLTAAFCLVFAGAAGAQEHFTEGPVWECSSYRTKPDYNAGDDAKSKEISAKHFKTSDEQKQRDMIAKRLAMRDFLGSSYYREVKLKPMP